SKDERVMDWWNRLMPLQGAPSYDDAKLGRTKALASGGPDPEKEDRVMLLRQRISRIYYRKHFFDYPISMKWETIRNMGFFTTMKAGFSYLKTCLFKKPETNLENFYINRFGRVLYGMFFEGYTEKLWGRHPSEISADWGAQRVKGLSIRALIRNMFQSVFGRSKNAEVETSLIEEFWYPKYGPGQLWELVADEITSMGGTILKGHSVKEIRLDQNRVTEVVCEVTGDEPSGSTGTATFTGDIFLSSMPVKDLVTGMTGPGKPSPDAVSIAEGLPYRDFVTVGLLVPRLNLKNETAIPTLGNIVPDDWIYVQDTDVKLGRIQIFNNWSPYMTQNPEETVWIGLEYFCTEGDAFWNMTDEECTNLAASELERMGIIDAKDVIDSHRERVKKAYPAYFDTYEHMDELISQLDRYENLYCIGRNGQHRYNNMDHSMATAFAAVDAIRSGSSDKTAIWNVNTEKSYHETKS
ncbi:MAG: NAD(P)/FAD-dependent oxidoreductase, partial [Clostridiales bacterium]|nr:NAD(P)/FAD-dependent oxidoreductase [Clostridiales bacterium]